MNKNVTNVLIFGAGVITGSIIMYTTMNKHNIEACNEVREYYKEKYENDSETMKEEPVKDSEEPKESDYEVRPVDRPDRTVKTQDLSDADYQDMIHKLNYNMYSTKPKKEKKEMVPVENKSDEPYLISAEEFSQLNGFDKVTYTYFEQDELFMDTHENIIENGLALVGQINLDDVYNADEPGVIYVRNEKYGKDIEVIVEEMGSYADFLAGDS